MNRPTNPSVVLEHTHTHNQIHTNGHKKKKKIQTNRQTILVVVAAR